ncbi:transposase [Luteibacter aegosomatissinici]|uniref:transposase n=1 Tax=Luteibacter aegosomatissinici TaxID=2911539 RepID=UPI001FFB385E|nr:transposase [Luteibacter aegosomatissinici]UPG93813.1 transposase [Luteibacter aegosomatissinici]UPG95643.1 transposase [Luteibacter aegosomatissinici]UPG96398.1 transposase [Luteibacter aegosomatissinici]
MGFKIISPAIKAEAIRLVVEAGYSAPQAAQITGVGPTALRRWVEEWRQQQAAIPATTAAQALLIEELREQLAASERAREVLAEERDVLKKQLPSHLAKILKPRRSSRR